MQRGVKDALCLGTPFGRAILLGVLGVWGVRHPCQNLSPTYNMTMAIQVSAGSFQHAVWCLFFSTAQLLCFQTEAAVSQPVLSSADSGHGQTQKAKGPWEARQSSLPWERNSVEVGTDQPKEKASTGGARQSD